jgi:DnaJ-class molecular chaperone
MRNAHVSWRNGLYLEDAITLFRKLGIDVRSIPVKDFTEAYHRLAWRYHPDRGNRNSHELMANINAARTVILKAQLNGGACSPEI